MRTIITITLCALSLACPKNIFGQAHESREFNGVTASFKLLNPNLRVRDLLKVHISLLNHSNRPVTFRYSEFFLHHIKVFNAQGEEASIKLNSPTMEAIAAEIPLKAHEKVERIIKVELSLWYDLTPGDYYLIFRYDLRDLPANVSEVYKKKLHSEDLVTWDLQKYPFHIQR